MTHEQALAKVAKLLRLAQSDNPHEAALASSRAQEIMDRFKLSGGDINLDGPQKPREEVRHFPDPLDIDGSARWKGQLGVVIAKQNQCKLYADHGLKLIGRASDVQTVRYLYAWMVSEIERLAKRDCAGNGRTWFNNFRLGAVETVCKKLRESAARTVEAVKQEAWQSGAGAIVLVEKSLAVIQQQERECEDYGKRVLHLRARSASRTNYNASAREAGRKAGGEIRIGGARAGLNSGTKQLH